MQDTFGLFLSDVYCGKTLFEIIERNDGFMEARDAKQAYFSNFEDWSGFEKKAIEYTKGRVIDIGCGAGRHSLFLQEKGFDVLATDISAGAISVCRKMGVRKTRVISIEKMTSLRNKFDTVLLLGNNFGLLKNEKSGQRILGELENITNKNAIIIASTVNPYRTDIVEHKKYHTQNIKKSRLAGEIVLRIRYKSNKGDWFKYLFISPEELRDFLSCTNWKVEKIFSPQLPTYSFVLVKK